MLSKREIAESVLLALGGGRARAGNHIDIRDVYNVIDMTGDELIATTAEAGEDFDIDSDWIRTYDNVLLRYDVRRCQVWAQLPAIRIGLKKDTDIRRVSWPKGTSNWPLEVVGSSQAFSLLEAGAYPSGTYPFTPEGDKLYFRTMPSYFKGEKILVSFVPAVSGYPEDEPLPMPEQYARRLMDSVVNFFKIQTAPAKMTNDSNPNTK